jgi:hypothetical protein
MVPLIPYWFLVTARGVPRLSLDICYKERLCQRRLEAMEVARIWEEELASCQRQEGIDYGRFGYVEDGGVVVKVFNVYSGQMIYETGMKTNDHFLAVHEENDHDDDAGWAADTKSIICFVLSSYLLKPRLPLDILKLIARAVRHKRMLLLRGCWSGGFPQSLFIGRVATICPTYDIIPLERHVLIAGSQTYAEVDARWIDGFTSHLEWCYDDAMGRRGSAPRVMRHGISYDETMPLEWSVETCHCFSRTNLGYIWDCCDGNIGHWASLGPASCCLMLDNGLQVWCLPGH